MNKRIDLIDKANHIRDQLRLLQMASIDDRDQRKMLCGFERAQDAMEDLLDMMRKVPKAETTP